MQPNICPFERNLSLRNYSVLVEAIYPRKKEVKALLEVYASLKDETLPVAISI